MKMLQKPLALRCLLLFCMGTIVFSFASLHAQTNEIYRPGPWHPHPCPYWRPYRPYMPYQTVPPYPGAIPLYYDGNIPVYDYTETPLRFYNPLSMEMGLRNLSNRPANPPSRPPKIRRAGDFDGDGKPDKTLPQHVQVLPRPLVKPAEQIIRTWKTRQGDVYEDGVLMGVLDGKVGIRTPDGKRHYILPDDFDEESKKTFDEWRQHK